MSGEDGPKRQCGPEANTCLWPQLELGLNPNLSPPGYVTFDKPLNLDYFIYQGGMKLRISNPQCLSIRIFITAISFFFLMPSSSGPSISDGVNEELWERSSDGFWLERDSPS